MKEEVNINEITLALNVLENFNATDLSNAEFYENGERLEIDKDVIDYFKEIGLTNKNFVELRFWEEAHNLPKWEFSCGGSCGDCEKKEAK